MGLSSLLPNGNVNVAALNIEMDVPVAAYHTPAGQGFLRIWGLGLADIGSAFDLNNMNIEIYGGMSAGLPLANPNQARLLVKGQIFQAFGNWIGVEQTVDIIFFPGSGTFEKPINLVLNWAAGTTLQSALQTTLSNGIPNAAISMSISPRLTQNHDEVGVYGSVTQLASFLNPLTKRVITDQSYPGVQMSYDGATITVWDATVQKPTKQIAFTDLIGQPTWIAPGIIQAKLVLRGDLELFDNVQLPPSLVGNTASALSSLSGNPANNTTFSGVYTILELHHYGNFRQPDAASWSTVINMTKQIAT